MIAGMDPEATFTIGEFARQTGLSERALRLYERRGLLCPASVDPATGYRHYTPDQVAEGRFVAMLRSIDMPLAEIQSVLAAPVSDRADLVAQYWYSVERSLDGHRYTVRQVRDATEEQEQGVSRTTAVVLEGRESGAFAAIAILAEIEAEQAVAAYAEAMRKAYWEHKDLRLAAAIAYAGVGRLLAAAIDVDEETASVIHSTCKGMMYDLASFSWPGWDEPDVEISAAEAAAGLGAARANLAMAEQLDKGDLALGRAHWMIGAHLLTGGEPRQAKDSFEQARSHAGAAGAAVEAELAVAFGHLADAALGVPGADEELETSMKRLAAFGDGEAFVNQVRTARAVLER